ncbi:hypothetical protein GCK32_022549, partial [Trichostrongylus colubriformis]
MCDQNALLRLLAAQATAQQQMLFGCGSGVGSANGTASHRGSVTNGSTAALLNGMLGAANPFMSPEMMLWQSMVAAQAQ